MSIRFRPLTAGRAVVVASLVALLVAGPLAADEGTTFTYQGELRAAGELVDATHAMSVTLWDAETGGAQVAGPLQFPTVAIAGGRFVLDLDFGADAIEGDRWLEITVDGFTLAPRQPLRPAPFSIRTRGIDVSEDGNVGIGVDASGGTTRLRVWSADTGAAIEAFALGGGAGLQAINQTTNQPAVFASNQDTEGTALYATVGGGQRIAQLGTPDTAVLGTAPDPDDWAARFAGRTYLGDRGWLGRTDPITGAEYFGFRAPVTSGYGGMYVSTDGANTRPFYGYAPDGVARAWTTYDGGIDAWEVYVNGFARFTVDDSGPVHPRIPIATAKVDEDGTVTSQTGGVLVDFFDGGFPSYVVTIPGFIFDYDEDVVQVTASTPSALTLRAANYGQGANGTIVVRIYNSLGSSDPSDFSIVVWDH